MLNFSNQDHPGVFGISMLIRKYIPVCMTALNQGTQQGEGLDLNLLATQPGSQLFISNPTSTISTLFLPSFHQEYAWSHSAGQ